MPLAISVFTTVAIAWGLLLLTLVALLALFGERRRQIEDRRRGPPDRRRGLADARSTSVERRVGPPDRRVGPADRRRATAEPPRGLRRRVPRLPWRRR